MSEPALPTPTKGSCPECGPDRLADILGHHQSTYHNERVDWGAIDYRILRCRGCEQVYFQRDESCSEWADYDGDPLHDVTYWPSPSKRKKPDWLFEGKLHAVDSDLAALFDSVYVALNNDLRVLSAIGIRTAFDRATELIGIDPSRKFFEKLSDLVLLGKIGTSEQETLDILTDAGSAAAHRGWKPQPQELDTMMSIIELFLFRNFISDPAAKNLKQKFPAKPKRR
jgi:hypothetical protein